MRFNRKSFPVALLALAVSFPQNLHADDALGGMMGGLIGSFIGTAIQNSGKATQQKKVRRSSGASSATKQQNRMVQTALNYFGFSVGTVDGSLGPRSRARISEYQALLGYPPTGQLSPFERDLLVNSYHRAVAGGQTTTIQAASHPRGIRGLLLIYRDELVRPAAVTAPANNAAPAQPNIIIQQVVAPASQVAAPAQAAAPAANTAVTSQDTVKAVQKTATASQAATSATKEKTENEITAVAATVAKDSAELNEIILAVADIDRQTAVLIAMLNWAREQPEEPMILSRMEVMQKRIDEHMARQKKLIARAANVYQTPIKPTNINLGLTALKIAEIQQKVPYYIPGTNEMGEMWVVPRVADLGDLTYQVSFLDPSAEIGKVREVLTLSSDEIVDFSGAFDTIYGWSNKAQEKNLRRNYEKRALCISSTGCDEKVRGTSSTEVIFVLNADGSTAAKIQRNKGAFSAAYNLSIESATQLAAYIDFMHHVGEKEFFAGTVTDGELDELFD